MEGFKSLLDEAARAHKTRNRLFVMDTRFIPWITMQFDLRTQEGTTIFDFDLNLKNFTSDWL